MTLRLLPLLSSFGILIILGFTVRWPVLWLYWLGAAILLAVAAGFLLIHLERLREPSFISNEPRIRPRAWLDLLPTPILFSAVAIILILFLETITARQLLMIMAAALIGFYWENLRRHIEAEDRYPVHHLESASLLVHVAVVWLSAAGFFRILLDPTILPPFLAANAYVIATVIIILVVFLLDYRAIWLKRYTPENTWLFLVVESLLVGEFFWVLNFLPLSPDVKSFLSALQYYAVAALARAHFDGTLRLAIVRRYIYFILIAAAAVLVTAKWLV